MLSPDDWVDVLWDGLKSEVKDEVPSRKKPQKTGRLFLSEYEIKKMINRDKVLRVPARAILSPLATDWLLLDGVRIILEAGHEG